ncbi:hypothetical protein BDV95DRAFT_581916 [Massariosphaeria phaeospora]|uniref:F-box domain-containing protein n=1 Tax=Massariosphaeria phaeospora TaxID=100035 RepID=A0A7C8I273_9PLEO|nr:hypothetical protein BDV95DRAFT_581916 [Massariosphaeria phaeospora]
MNPIPVSMLLCRSNHEAELFWSRFTALPIELRELVYSFLFEAPCTCIILRNTARTTLKFPALLPALCYVNRQTFYESMPVLFRGRSVTIRGDTCMRLLCGFLDRVPDSRAYRTITTLHLESPFHDRPDADALLRPGRLVGACTGLRHLAIDIHAPDAEDATPSLDSRSVRACIRQIPLEAFQCRVLKTLELRCVGWQRLDQTIEDAKELYRPVVTWVKQKMEENRCVCDLKVSYVPWERESWGFAPRMGWGASALLLAERRDRRARWWRVLKNAGRWQSRNFAWPLE